MKHKLYKRCIFALALLLATSAIVDAQISISKFEEDPMDIEGRVDPSKREKPQSGGELYALIKVSTGLNCSDFYAPDCGQGSGVGEVDCSEGHVWMYAPAGATKISIKHKTGGSLESYPLPAPLKAGMVYLMTLISGTQRTFIDEQLGAGYIVVKGHVEGATIKIGGTEEIMTDKRWVKSLPLGTYEYEISASGYEPFPGKATIVEGQAYEVTVNMISSIGELSITSLPETGASILIDGKLQNEKTPAVIKLNKGKYEVTVTKELFKPAKRTIQINPGKTTPFEAELAPNFAVVSVHSADNGKIFIDNNLVATGNYQGRLKTELHTLIVEKDSHRPYKKSITVVTGKDQTIEVPALEPIYGKLNIEIIGGYNAKVFIDDVEKSAITPTTINELLIGERTVRLVPDNPDKEVYYTKVVISEGKITPLKPDLKDAPKYADLIINTVPDGSYVYINEQHKGKAPLTLPNLKIDMGQVKIKATHSGYKDREITHTLTRGDNRINFTLEEIPLGTLKINVYGLTGASVTVDEASTVTNTNGEAVIKDLSVGTHKVRVSYIGYKSYEKATEVRKGDNMLYVRLKEKPFGPIDDPTTFIDWRISPASASYVGLSVGMAHRWGGYASFRASKSMFNPYPNVFSKDILGEPTEIGVDDLTEFEKTHKRFSLTGGPMLRLSDWLYVYGGVGYGLYAPHYRYAIKDENDDQTIAVALVEPGKTSGLEVEYGAKVNLGGFTLSAGHSTILGSSFGELHFGAGVALDDRSIFSLFGGEDFDLYSSGDFDRNDIHKAAGGFHMKIGAGINDMGQGMLNYALHYNNSKFFPLNVELGGAVDPNSENAVLYGGLYSGLHFSEHFSIDFGGGYQGGERSSSSILHSDNLLEYDYESISQPYYKIGMSYMIKGSSWGGFNYSYQRGFGGKGTPFGMHLFTYTVGTTPTLVTIATGLVVGLAAILYQASEEEQQTYY
jgi:hypothetical protein